LKIPGEKTKALSLRCRAILLDMDGTLVDSTAIIHRTWKWWADRHSLPVEPILAVERGRPNREVIRQFGPHLDADAESELFLKAEKADVEGLTIIPGSHEVVRAAQQGKWAIVTSAERSLAEVRLRAVGIPIPAVMVTADDIQHGKPDPECYLLAARRLDVSASDCVVFEDSPSGVLSGKAAGMPVIAVGPYVDQSIGAALHVRDYREMTIRSDLQGFTIEVPAR
jgi:sugar-phosphatase